MEISYQKRPFTQASRKYNKLLKPDSLHRIPTPLNLCVHQTFIYKHVQPCHFPTANSPQ